MSLEIAALVAGVAGVKKLVDETLPLVDTITARFSSRTKAAKADVEAKLKEIKERLPALGQLAEVADAYVETLDQVHRLYVDCVVLDQYLRVSEDMLANRLGPEFDAGWATADQLLDVVNRDRVASRKTHQDRQKWLDTSDDARLVPLLNEVNIAYERCAAFAEARRPGELRDGLKRLQEPLMTADTLLRTTLREDILRRLASELRQ